MRIVILGAGHLGYTIAELLSNEQHDVVVADSDEEKLSKVRDSLDVLTITANGTSPDFTRDPDIRDASVFVAVTEMDEVNILASMLAKKNGIPHTIARIRDPKFLQESTEYLQENFDIDLVLSPELVTAKEIRRILMTPAALNVGDFANGRVRLYETRIQRQSPYIHIPFKDLELPDEILAAMIFRDHQMIIPHGNDCLLPYDNAYFIGAPENIEKFSRGMAESSTRHIKKAIIIGAGRTGTALVPMLEADGISVKVIDLDPEQCQHISSKLKKSIVLCGDGADIDLLMQEGVSEADVVICTTKDERLNLLVALLARHLGAKKTIVRVVRGEYADLMTQVGVDIALSVRLLAAGEVLSYVRSRSVVSVSLLESAQVEAVEVILESGAPAEGIPLMKAGLPAECLVGAYVRNETTHIPDGRSVLAAGDRVIILIRTPCSAKVLPYFKGRKPL